MRIKPIGSTLTSGLVVYLVVACSSAIVRAKQDPNAKDGGDEGPVPSAHADDTVSGSRIKARHIKGADGTIQPYGLFDTQLDTPCTFATAADGKLRCLPTAAVLSEGSYAMYTDPTCNTVASIVVGWSACAPRYGTKPGTVTQCGGYTSKMYKLNPISGAYRYDSLSPSSTCVRVTEGDAFFTLGDEVDPSVFVAATIE